MLVLTGARLFDGERFLDDRVLIVEGGAIVGVTPYAERPRGGTERDLSGGILAPGFIDWQVNGGGGALFNESPSVEGIKAIVEAHRKFGTTAMLPTLITDAPGTLAAALEAAKAAADEVPGALGIHVEGPYIDPRRKGAHPPEWIRPMRESDAAALIAARSGVMVVTLAPASAPNERIAQLAKSGIVVSLGHSDATTEEAQAAFDSGVTAITHLFNAMSQLAHRAPGVVGAALTDPRVTCGFIADGYHVHEAAARVAFKAKGVNGIALVSDAMPPAAGGPKIYELSGRRVTQDGLKLTLDDGTLAGAAITMLDAVRYVQQTLGLELADTLAMATSTPARLLKIDDKFGSLKQGFRADLVHLGDDLGLKGVWVGGAETPLPNGEGQG
jgi:N-acetylglucosamine-6-phosphate deacetylase